MVAASVPFALGHGTGNRFVVLADRRREVPITMKLVRSICDQERGYGVDGLLIASQPSQEQSVVDENPVYDLVMGYYNADGSPAEMCGNGIRVLVDYALELGWLTGESWVVQTPSGLMRVTRKADHLYEVEMGKAELGNGVTVVVGSRSLPATAVTVPNPHAVVFLDSLGELGTLDQPPGLSARDFPAGANVEFVETFSENQARMIIYERGSGLTQSCGTGACAVAAVLASRKVEPDSVETFQIGVPGGNLEVEVSSDLGVRLIGPAEIYDRGVFDQEWLVANS